MFKATITKEDVERYNDAYVKAGGLSKEFQEENSELITSIKKMLLQEVSSEQLNKKDRKIMEVSALVIAELGKDADAKAIRHVLKQVKTKAVARV